DVLHDAAASPAGLLRPRLRAGEPPRDRARRARDDRTADLARDHGRRPGAGGRGRQVGRRGGCRSMTVRLPSRYRLWQVAADAGLVALAWYLSFQIRFDQGVY